MYDNPDPRAKGAYNAALSQIKEIQGDGIIGVSNGTGMDTGIVNLSFSPKLGYMYKFMQDYAENSGTSGIFATYSYGKMAISANYVVYHRFRGYSSQSGQHLDFRVNGLLVISFITGATGAWEATIESRTITGGSDINLYAMAMGKSAEIYNLFANTLGNQLSLDFGSGMTFEINFSSGSGTAYCTSFDVEISPQAT